MISSLTRRSIKQEYQYKLLIINRRNENDFLVPPFLFQLFTLPNPRSALSSVGVVLIILSIFRSLFRLLLHICLDSVY